MAEGRHKPSKTAPISVQKLVGRVLRSLMEFRDPSIRRRTLGERPGRYGFIVVGPHYGARRA
jgi:hypothetical protein